MKCIPKHKIHLIQNQNRNIGHIYQYSWPNVKKEKIAKNLNKKSNP